MTVRAHHAALAGQTPPTRAVSVDLETSLRFFEMLSTMLASGVPLVQGLEALRRQPELAAPLERTQRALLSGHSLSRAFALGGFRDPVVLGLLQLGERTGTLDRVVGELASIFRWRYRLHSELKSRLTYPALLALACAILVALGPPLMLRPILDFLRQSGAELPVATRLLLGFVESVCSPSFWMAGSAALALALWFGRRLIRRAPGFGERWLLSRPVIGACLSQLYTARFGRALQAGLGTGYPLLAAMELAAVCSGSAVVEDECRVACAALRDGETPERAFQCFRSLDPLLRSAVPLGLSIGAVESLLGAVLHLTEEKLRYRVDELLGVLEPVLLMAMGAGVALCILATVSPMMSLLQAVS